MSVDPLLDEILGLVPQALRDVSGSLLYSGRDAFTNTSALYLMGINPGGDPTRETGTVAEQATAILCAKPANYSSYRDESWANGTRPRGTSGMQPRVLHLLNTLGLDPGTVPASNMVFARSSREGDIQANQMKAWAHACWPFHEAMIERLGVRVIVCFGGTVSVFVRSKIGTHEETGHFIESNNRRWSSRSYRGPGEIAVVQVTHPSIADWRNPSTDVSPLVASALAAL